MKKLTILIVLLSVWNLSSAQTETQKSVVTANVGFSIIGNAFGVAIKKIADDDVVSIANSPVIIGAYDFGVTKLFSIGILGGYESVTADFNYAYGGSTKDSIKESISASGSRLTFAIRPNVHYVNKDKLDMYSGFKVGFLIRNIEHNSKNKNFDIIDLFDGNRLTMGVTILGIRYFVHENIGLNMEIGLGAPAVVSGGVNFRF